MAIGAVNWKVVINYNFLENSLVEDAGHVDSVFVDLEVGKDGFDTILFLGKTSNGT